MAENTCTGCGAPYSGNKCPYCGNIQSLPKKKSNAFLAASCIVAAVLILVVIMTVIFTVYFMPAVRTSHSASAEIPVTKASAEWIDGGIYEEGEYLVGDKLPAGTYAAVEESSTGLVLTVAADESCEQEYYAYALTIGNVIFTVEDGQYLHGTNCRIYNLDKVNIKFDPFAKPGMFRAGTDIEPGTYNIQLYGEYGPRICQVYSDVTSVGPVIKSGSVNEIIEKGELTEKTTVT
ncbi:MAG: hypothetical protein IJY74_06805, partial [Oscillospiraceae bacterium]|nr:hypothetical protein [Oscillospiraceae bacterium]